VVAPALDLGSMAEVKMAYDSERQKVLAQNIANIDTPGYRAQELMPLDFHNVLAAQTQQVALSVTSDGHLNGNHAVTQRFRSEYERNPFEITPSGGTVVLEEQMMKISQNATDYTLSTDLYKKIGNLFKEAMSLQPSP
jgi:flagellar basal-body rod protein FlgB